jgi:aminoglycoside phosphotransferase (APT) family kinase protein
MFRVRTERDDFFVVRIYPKLREKVAAYEAQLIQRYRDAGCSVPEVISYECARSADVPPHLIYRYIRGETLTARRTCLTSRQLQDLARALLKNLQLMASCSVSGFGGLITAGSADDPTPWQFFQRSLSCGIESAKRSKVIDARLIDCLMQLLETCEAEVSKFDGALAWGDLAPSNILVDENDELAGIIDFESTFALDCSLSAGYFYAIAPGEPLLAALLREGKSTGFEFDERKLKLCAILRAARVARFAHKDLPSGAPQRSIAAMLPGAVQVLPELVNS